MASTYYNSDPGRGTVIHELIKRLLPLPDAGLGFDWISSFLTNCTAVIK